MKGDRASRRLSTPGGKLRIALSFSSGIRAIRNIESFLKIDEVWAPGRIRWTNLDVEVVAVLVWGRKLNTAKALEYAKSRSLPVWFLEDGFIRSCEADAHSRKTYSLLVDKSGVYYDSAYPNDLETFLNLPDDQFDKRCDRQALYTAAECRKLLVQNDITKYNYCRTSPTQTIVDPMGRELVMVIDQTLNDASVKCGAMTADLFKSMLDAAVSENPSARIVVRTHPDVVSGRRPGYLIEYARECGVEVSAEADNPIVWLKHATRVYVGTSQLGYEALLCNCKVTTFGQPFYSSWGLTDDRNPLTRRVRSRSLDQLFFASHIALTQYRDPVFAMPWTLRQCLEHVIEQKRQFARNAHSFQCVGISRWKRQYLSRYLRSPDGSISFCSGSDTVKPEDKLLTWSYRSWPSTTTMQPVRVEDGFLRSNGLGSDFFAPASLVVDMQGMYFDRHRPSDLEQLLNSEQCTQEQRVRAAKLREMIVSAGLSKYNMPERKLSSKSFGSRDEAGRSVILIVGQVEDDESIRRGSAAVNTNSALCQAVKKKRPDDYLVYKPHPDVESGNRYGAVSDHVLEQCIDEVANGLSITQALEQCDECHTMTSLTGFEALLRGKRVVTYGLPFYAGWGLTEDELACDRRTRVLTLDELVFMSLIAYPRYLHVDSGEFITPEDQVRYLATQEANSAIANKKPQWITKIDNIAKSLRYVA